MEVNSIWGARLFETSPITATHPWKNVPMGMEGASACTGSRSLTGVAMQGQWKSLLLVRSCISVSVSRVHLKR